MQMLGKEREHDLFRFVSVGAFEAMASAFEGQQARADPG
jgi:hypothetical protein